MLNETPKPSPAKTKSAPKLLIIGVALLILAAALAIILPRLQSSNSREADTTLTIGTGSNSAKSFELETVTSEEDQIKGLSGRRGLENDKGMQFKYSQTGERCIWMKDMKFSIDVIWLDSRGRVVSAVQNMSPASYPQKYCAQAVSVIELPAGTIRQQGLRAGQVLTLPAAN